MNCTTYRGYKSEVHMPIIFNQEEKSVVNEIVKRLNAVCDERKPLVQEVKFELSRICKAECGREISNNYVVLYLFKVIKVQVAP